MDKVPTGGSSPRRRDSSVSSLSDHAEEDGNDRSRFLFSGSHISYNPAPRSPSASAKLDSKSEIRSHVQPVVANRNRLLNMITRHWWLESLALIALITIFAAIVVTLRLSQKKPLPEWPLDLTLNTLVSVFGAVFRVPLLFIAAEGLGQIKWHWAASQARPLHHLTIYDEATRGPWGSLKLLWITRGRQIAATMGASIAIVAIALDPFTQAVIGLYDCTFEDPSGHSTIARTNTLGYYSIANNHNPMGTPMAFQKALVAGLMAPGAITVKHNCSSGNCTFLTPYHAVGYCNECSDITNDLRRDCSDEQNGNCTYSLPSGLAVGAYNSIRRTDHSFESRSWDIYFAIGPHMTPIGGAQAPNLTTAEYPIEAIAAKGGADIESAIAFTCRLTPCVKSFTATIVGSVMTESLIESTNFNQSYRQFPPEGEDDPELIQQLIRSDCLTDDEKSTLSDHGIDIGDQDWIPWHKSKLNDTVPVQPRCVYQFETMTHAVIQNFIATYFNGTVNTGGYNDDTIHSAEQSPFEVLYDNEQISFGSFNATFGSIAEAITNTIRDPPPSLVYLNESEAQDANFQYRDVSPAEGSTKKDTSCIHVRWPWLALPAALMVGAAMFLGLTIASTLGDTTFGVWKSSQVALLWHGLDGQIEHEGEDLWNVREMDQRAKNVQVQLRRTHRGWRLAEKT